MTMKVKRYEIILEAERPIAHHAETIGNSAVAMRRKVRTPDGFAQVPIVTGDTMRHGLREASSYAMLDAAGLLSRGGLSESALRLLFAGGAVTGRGDAGTVKLDAYRDMVDLVPPLALLGGCASNRVIPGRLQVEDAMLVCEESQHLIPPWIVHWAREHRGELDTCRAHVEEVQRVRMDPTLSPEKRRLLSDGARTGVEQRLLASETAHAEDDAAGKEDAKSSMMPRRFETIVAGSLFSWTVTCTVYDELEEDTFDVMVGTFLSRPIVGGKRGTGHGVMKPIKGNEVPVARMADRYAEIDLAGLAPTRGSLFRKHVADRSDKIAAFLAEVEA